VPAAILAPDIAMTGYLAGTRPGAHLYNLTHATPLPAVMLAVGYWQANRLVMAWPWSGSPTSAWTGSSASV
jgi:hypothetical protein